MESEHTSMRELSPESRNFVLPPPPKGTLRRPAKKAPLKSSKSPSGKNASRVVAGIDLQPDTSTLAGFIEHVESLDPQDDEKPLYDFSKKWISQPKAEWPTSADNRLYRYMHTHRYYEPRHREDRRELEVINILRHNTELAEVRGQPEEYNKLKLLVLNRIKFLSQELLLKKILAYDDKKELQMTKAFEDVWTNKDDYWEKKRSDNIGSTTIANEIAHYDSPNLYDDEEDDCVPRTLRKKSKLKAKSPIGQRKICINTTHVVPLRRRSEESTSLNSDPSSSTYRSPYSNKRQRTEAYDQPTPENGARESVELSTGHMPTAVMVDDTIDTYAVDLEIEEHVRLAEEVLRSPTKTVRPSTPEPAVTSPRSSAHPYTAIREQQMTPESAVASANQVFSNDPVTPLAARPVSVDHTNAAIATPGLDGSSILSPSTPPSSSKRKAASTSPVNTFNRSPLTTPGRNNPELVVILQRSNGTFDLTHKLPYKTYIPRLVLSAFCALFSQRSGVPLSELDYLTFKLDFGNHPQQIEVIRRDSREDEWNELKDRIRKFFKFVRKGSPREKDFDIWVEIGRGQDMEEYGDVGDELDGF